MTCANCKDGQKCASCEIKDMGFVQKSYVDDMIKQLHAEPRKDDTGTEHVRGDIDALFAHSDSCPNPDTCKISQRLNQIKAEYYNMGFASGAK